jgi:hypothetical protein
VRRVVAAVLARIAAIQRCFLRFRQCIARVPR